MGFESFRVELRGDNATHGEADENLRSLAHIEPDLQSLATKGSTFYVMDDGQYVLELELAESPLRISCRFTLCHPPSVDQAFLALVRELMMRLTMEARICDDVRPEHARPYALAEFADFSAIASRYIATRRSEWIAAFGDAPLSATTSDVYRRVILPRCQPGIEQPT